MHSLNPFFLFNDPPCDPFSSFIFTFFPTIITKLFVKSLDLFKKKIQRNCLSIALGVLDRPYIKHSSLPKVGFDPAF